MLQATLCDLIKAYENARDLIHVLEQQRTDDVFSQIFSRAKMIADSIDVVPSIPRTTKRQIYRANAEATTPEIHFRINIYFPFLDYVIRQMDQRFPEDIKPLLYGYYMIPTNLDLLSDEIITNIQEEYKTDMPSPLTFRQELTTWIARFNKTKLMCTNQVI